MDWIDRMYAINHVNYDLLDADVKEKVRSSAEKYADIMRTQKVSIREAKLVRFLTAYLDSDVLSKKIEEIFECNSESASLIVEGSNW